MAKPTHALWAGGPGLELTRTNNGLYVAGNWPGAEVEPPLVTLARAEHGVMLVIPELNIFATLPAHVREALAFALKEYDQCDE